MAYSGYYFFGMDILWWFLGILFLFTIFGIFKPVHRNRFRKGAPLDILQKRFAKGEITKEAYQERKNIIEPI